MITIGEVNVLCSTTNIITALMGRRKSLPLWVCESQPKSNCDRSATRLRTKGECNPRGNRFREHSPTVHGSFDACSSSSHSTPNTDLEATGASNVEKRFLATEVRAISKGNKRTIAGYAARYCVLSGDLGGFRERIASGAFKRILATNPDVVCLFNHSDSAVLGRTTAGTLRLSEDTRGLKFECDLPDTTFGRDTYESVKRGDLNGCSFAFMVDDSRMCEYKE